MTAIRKKIYRIGIAAAVLLLHALNSYSQWNADPAINTPVCTTPGSQQLFPQIVSDGSGGAFITWSEGAADMSSVSVFAQHISSTGTKLWATAGVDVNGGIGIPNNPQIVTDGNGGAIIAWADIAGGVVRHYVQKINSSGQLQWNAGGVLVCPATVAPLIDYELLPDKNGGCTLLWDDSRSGNNQVYAQHIDADGNLLWALNGVPCSPNFTILSSFDAVADSTGGIILSYILNAGGLNGHDSFVQHINENGVAEWGPLGIDLSNAPSDQLFARIAKDTNDNVIVIWQDFRLDPVWSQIYGQRIDAQGNIKWQTDGKLLVDSVVPTSTFSKIVADTKKGAIITWLDDFTGGQSTVAHLRSVRIDSTGSFVWMKQEVATWQEAQMPAQYELASDFKGGCFISWTQIAAGPPAYYDLGAQHVFPDGTVEFGINGQLVSSAPMNQYYQQLMSDSSGLAIVAWSDQRSGADYDLYAARIAAPGTLPVTWVNFSGSMNGSSAVLTWETADEVNNKGFTIQRSQNGIGFDNIGFVAASENYKYAFTDPQPHNGSNYYRLQQKDIDGEISFSRTIRINFGQENIVSVYPNPASRFITVRGTSGGSTIGIYGADGRRYQQLRSTGSHVEIDISKMPKGMYFLRVTEANNSQTFIISVID